MKALKWIVIVIVAIVAALVAIGFLLPSTFRVERSAAIGAPPEKVYAIVSDPREWKKWSAWNQRDPGMVITYSGPDSGKGAKWEWTSKTEGNGWMEFVAAEPGKRIDYVLHFPDMGMSSKGAWTFAPEGAGTRVTWTNEGDVGSNPVYRYFAQVMDSLVGPDFEKGLAGLKALAEKP